MAVERAEAERWLFDLFLRREVLSEFEEPVLDLVGLCKTREEYSVVTHTIEHLIVLTQSQLASQIARMTAYVEDHISAQKKLAIVAMAWGDQPDSSQLLVQMLKPHFRRNSNIKFFNSVPAFEKKYNVNEYPRFILVDDFCGTGKTVLNRHNHIINNASGRGIQLEAFACLLFGMEAALENLLSHGVQAHFCTSLRAGISGHFEAAELTSKIESMKRLEEELAEQVDGVPMPSMGHGGAEALFFIKDGNAPNSNFPIFWWPEDNQGEERNTIMQRAEP